jgi:hypothetical protein
MTADILPVISVFPAVHSAADVGFICKRQCSVRIGMVVHLPSECLRANENIVECGDSGVIVTPSWPCVAIRPLSVKSNRHFVVEEKVEDETDDRLFFKRYC